MPLQTSSFQVLETRVKNEHFKVFHCHHKGSNSKVLDAAGRQSAIKHFESSPIDKDFRPYLPSRGAEHATDAWLLSQIKKMTPEVFRRLTVHTTSWGDSHFREELTKDAYEIELLGFEATSLITWRIKIVNRSTANLRKGSVDLRFFWLLCKEVRLFRH